MDIAEIESISHKKRHPLLYSPKRHANAYQTYTNRERPNWAQTQVAGLIHCFLAFSHVKPT